ncbi:hypothetical protein RHSIM_Rhsim08G0234800 [Rhododendron simsii]|uniref:Uncharacterized protein n=1 Tax=Rhododendron simsii TaxID=118357 RepID=A0A834GJT4_RHOSS|nr:hypothetical protein RHSIM_Rhsim08G0234800 [Rhododendron simsii]
MISYTGTAAPCYKVTSPKMTVQPPYDDPAGLVGHSMPKLCEMISCAMPSSSTASQDQVDSIAATSLDTFFPSDLNSLDPHAMCQPIKWKSLMLSCHHCR